MPEIADRSYPREVCSALVQAGVHPVLARVFASRGIESADQLATALDRLARPDRMDQLQHMATILADAIAQQRRLLIVADYDCDGATACAVGLNGLRAFGAQVDYLVPNRFDFGYGLTPEIVAVAAQKQPDYLITVDNGIAACAGVAAANQLGIKVLITDHHLPGSLLPDAACIVNPNQPGCTFPSKHLAGVGVMFYVLLQLRAELRDRGAFQSRGEPNLASLLDLVALGTVADLVRLDHNNRVLVHQGLARIRAGRSRPGIAALLRIAGREPQRVSPQDLAFAIAPRLNAAGRLEDMSLGIECLMAQDDAGADVLAERLDALNRQRREIEMQMQEDALARLDSIEAGAAFGVALYDPTWHQGVVGILAARLRERLHRPVIAFAPAGGGVLKGSGRSIPSLHLRDALDLIDKRNSGLLQSFGGHAGAAGVSLRESDLDAFRKLFDTTLREILTPADLAQRIDTDGELAPSDWTLQLADQLAGVVWGQGFPVPRFRGRFDVAEQRVVGERHLRLRLTRGCAPVDAVLFGHGSFLPEAIDAVYRLEANDWRGARAVQLVLEHWEPAHVEDSLESHLFKI